MYYIVKEFIVSKYHKLIEYIKSITIKKSEINKQTKKDDIHVVKAKVKKVKAKKLKTN